MAEEKQESYKARGVWKKAYESKTYRTWSSSVHRDASQLKRVIDDIGYERTIQVMNYYFSIQDSPDFMYFIYNYDKLGEALDSRTAGIEHSRKLREATRQRMKELGFEV